MLTHYRRKFFKITAFSDFNSISKHMLLTVLTCRGTCLQQIKTLNHIFEIKSNAAKRITPPAETKCHKTGFKDTGGEVRGWKRERWWGKSRRVPKEMPAEPPPRDFWKSISDQMRGTAAARPPRDPAPCLVSWVKAHARWRRLRQSRLPLCRDSAVQQPDDEREKKSSHRITIVQSGGAATRINRYLVRKNRTSFSLSF